MYEINPMGAQHGVFKVDEGLWIPNDPKNRHWIEYQEWCAKGNVAPVKIIFGINHKSTFLQRIKKAWLP